MNRTISIAILAMVMVGCLKTRAELEEEATTQQQQRTTIAQQRSAAQPVKEKAPPSAYRFEEVDEQMRSLTGRVDSLENAIQQMKTAKQSDNDLSARDKQSYDREFKAFEEAIRKLEQQMAAMNEEIAHLKAPPPAPEPEKTAKGGKVPLESAEKLFSEKKWKEAIVNFQKYRDQNPKGKQYADATYKIGVCFQELGMKDEARSFLEEVTGKFPSSKEAKKAAYRLKSLK